MTGIFSIWREVEWKQVASTNVPTRWVGLSMARIELTGICFRWCRQQACKEDNKEVSVSDRQWPVDDLWGWRLFYVDDTEKKGSACRTKFKDAGWKRDRWCDVRCEANENFLLSISSYMCVMCCLIGSTCNVYMALWCSKRKRVRWQCVILDMCTCIL